MGYMDLLDRMRNNDTEAFLEMTECYGWSVYSVICEKYPDPAVADKIYNETMNTVYHSLAASPEQDPLEALLCAFARHISPEVLTCDRRSSKENLPPKICLRGTPHPGGKADTAIGKKKSFWHWLSILLILLLLALLLWYISGLLMMLGLLPYFDLGYSWLEACCGYFLGR